MGDRAICDCRHCEVQSKLHQYDALKAEVRDYDKLIWGTPSIGAAVTGITLNLVFNEQVMPLLSVRISAVIVGAILNFAMFHGLVKHRLFQEQLNRLIDQLEEQLPMIQEPKRTEEILCLRGNRLKGFLYGKRAYETLRFTQAILFALLTSTIPHILWKSDIGVVMAFPITLIILYCLVTDP